MQRLAQIMARSRQEAGLRQVGQLKLVRAFLDLAFQRCIGSLELLCHAVELLPQGLELVARPDKDALVQISPADPRRCHLQRFDGNDQAPRNHEARQAGKPQRNGKQ